MSPILHNPKDLAMMVKSYRKQQKLSQGNLAELVGLKQSTISAFERRPETTKLDTLFRILSATHLDLSVYPKNSPDSNSGWQEEW